MDESTRKYQPGVCNIGIIEVRRRKRLGYIGLALTFAFILVLEILDVDKPYRLLILAPVYLSLSGFIQAGHRFCYVYGWHNVFSMEGRKQFHTVEEKSARRKDRLTALKILAQVTIASLLISFFYYLI